MKFLPSFCLLATLSVSSSLAGSMGGPAPFRNGSPLASGTDGTYNATISGNNLSGVMRFSIASGSQNGTIFNPRIEASVGDVKSPASSDGKTPETYVTTNPSYAYSQRKNNWVAWFEGKVYRGLTDVAITDNTVSGVLDITAPLGAQEVQPKTGVAGSNGISLSNTPPVTKVYGNWNLQQASATSITSVGNDVEIPKSEVNYTGFAPDTMSFGTVTMPNTGTVLLEAPPVIDSTLQGGSFSGTIAQNNPNGTIQGSGSFVIIRNKGTLGGLSSSNLQYVASEVGFRWKGARVNISGDATNADFSKLSP